MIGERDFALGCRMGAAIADGKLFQCGFGRDKRGGIGVEFSQTVDPGCFEVAQYIQRGLELQRYNIFSIKNYPHLVADQLAERVSRIIGELPAG